MFARRNSITLGALWLLLIAIGTFWYMNDGRKLEQKIEDEKQVRDKLTKSQSEIKRLTTVENAAAELRKKWLDSPKRIISAEEPSFTLSYINWIMSSNNLSIYYDFVLNSKSTKGDHTKFAYTLTGEGTYNDINKLVWFLTYEPIFYKIKHLTLKKNDLTSDYLQFNMSLEGYSVESQSDLTDQFEDFKPNPIKTPPIQHDVFAPLVRETKVVTVSKPVETKPQLPPKLPGQIDVEKASLKAVTATSIFISEGGSGVKELKIGDPVYLGRLVDINLRANEAVFLITKFGESERITLRINERQ